MFCLYFYFTVVKILRVIFKYRFEQWFEYWNILLKQRWNIPLYWKIALSKEEMIFKEMTDNIDELFRVSLLNQILFPLIRMLEVTTCVWTFGILLMEKYWFVNKKLIILFITTLLPSCIICILWAKILWVRMYSLPCRAHAWPIHESWIYYSMFFENLF